ncbi:MAG: SH3 domain-containing protein [Prolixibacteraceae bacterium]|nr:SH3 domain-containing protein [Prolixibacteraceae bacterium]
MALIICPECNKEISNQAKSCPNCGYPLKSKVIEWDIENENKKKQEKDEFLKSLGEIKKTNQKILKKRQSNKDKKRDKSWRNFFWFLGATVVFMVIALSTCEDNGNGTYHNNELSQQNDNSIDLQNVNATNILIKYSMVSLNVRKRPNEESRVLKVLKPNEKVTTKGEQKNGFTQILDSNNRNYGWCATNYLQDSPLSEKQLADIEQKRIEAKEKRENAWKNKDNSIGAWTIVTMTVKEMLVSPRTAKFPWGGPSEHVTRNGQVYTVKSYVDSQNGFGAMIRTHFIAKVEQTSENKWKAISFETY